MTGSDEVESVRTSASSLSLGGLLSGKNCISSVFGSVLTRFFDGDPRAGELGCKVDEGAWPKHKGESLAQLDLTQNTSDE